MWTSDLPDQAASFIAAVDVIDDDADDDRNAATTKQTTTATTKTDKNCSDKGGDDGVTSTTATATTVKGDRNDAVEDDNRSDAVTKPTRRFFSFRSSLRRDNARDLCDMINLCFKFSPQNKKRKRFQTVGWIWVWGLLRAKS